MKKSLLAAALLAGCAVNAQVALPYHTGFDSPAEQADWTQYRKGINSQFQEWEFDNAQSFSPSLSLIHYYQVGGSEVMDDWFVSPSFDISGGGQLDSIRYYFSGFGIPNDQEDTVFIYLLNGSADPDLATTKQELFRFDAANYQNDNTWRKLDPVALPPLSGSSYLAIRYRTIANWLDVRFDNVSISGSSTAETAALTLDGARVYPNPAVDAIFIDSPETGAHRLTVFDAAGKIVYSSVTMTGEPLYPLLDAGCYHYRLSCGKNAAAITGKLIIVR